MAQVKYLITLILYFVLHESLHPRQKHRARAIKTSGVKPLYVQSLYIATLVNLDHAEEYRQICS